MESSEIFSEWKIPSLSGNTAVASPCHGIKSRSLRSKGLAGWSPCLPPSPFQPLLPLIPEVQSQLLPGQGPGPVPCPLPGVLPSSSWYSWLTALPDVLVSVAPRSLSGHPLISFQAHMTWSLFTCSLSLHHAMQAEAGQGHHVLFIVFFFHSHLHSLNLMLTVHP